MRSILLTLVLTTWGAVPAQSQIPRGTAQISLNGTTMQIEYGRPSLNGRDMLAKAPVGTVWRMGADKSSTLSLDGAAVFGNIVVSAGEYSVFLERTSDTGWSLIVNKQTGQWGTEHNRDLDLAGIPLKWEKSETSFDPFSIEMTKETDETGILTIAWGREALKQRFRLPPVNK